MLADLARGVLRKKLPALRPALTGRLRAHHGFLVAQILAHLDYLDEVIATVSGQVDVIAPFTADMARLDTIPGINQRTAEVIIAEIGVDMRVFPSAGHLASWAGLCPGNNESAGKHEPAGVRSGNRWLRSALTEAALAGRSGRPRGRSVPGIGASCRTAATRRPLSRSLTSSSWRPIICWRVRRPIVTRGRTTTNAATPSGSAVERSRPL